MSEHGTAVAFLKGKRVILRPLLRQDIPHLLKWINDEDVTQYLATYLPMMEADEEKWVDDLAKDKQANLVFLIVTTEGKSIGTMGLHRISWKDRVATTGALIGEKDYWGKGYGTESKMLLLNYAFNTLNLRKICSSVLAYNRRSYAYQVKCGYREEGRRRRQFYRKGRYWDEVFMAVFKEDWLPLWRKYRKIHLQ
ncbi:MAG: GNAT family protein [Patescibacteria group bacterium]